MTVAVQDHPLEIESLPSDLQEIAERVIDGHRLSPGEGLRLITAYDHVEEVGRLADFRRQQMAGDLVYFASTLYIHPTNLCELSCPMCSYYAKPGWEKAWFLTPDQVMARVEEAHPHGLTEIHVVGGLWRDCNLDYYEEIFTRIKALDPSLHIKALTPVEYDFLAELHNIPVETVFLKMMEWGLGSLPGGGAEVLVEEIRKQVAPQKISSERFLEIHEIAHNLGLRSNITMLFGHVEEPEHLITHLCKVRDLQDRTGGFQTFIPLRYHVENNALGRRKKRLKEVRSIHLIYATARLMLDNVRNLKVLWNYLGVSLAQELLHMGANDFSSTNQQEKIIRMAGGVELPMTRELISELIQETGRTPFEIHSGYNYLDERVHC